MPLTCAGWESGVLGLGALQYVGLLTMQKSLSKAMVSNHVLGLVSKTWHKAEGHT